MKTRFLSSFYTGRHCKHHIELSACVALPIDMLFTFPLDYMHLVNSKGMNKLFSLWLHCPAMKRRHLRRSRSETLGKCIVACSDGTLSDFQRLCRYVDDVDLYKVTTFCRIYLLLDTYVLRDYSLMIFRGVSCFFCVYSYFAPPVCTQNLQCLCGISSSVQVFSLLCVSSAMVYSVDALIHLPEDTLRHGALDSFPCSSYDPVIRYQNLVSGAPRIPLSCSIAAFENSLR